MLKSLVGALALVAAVPATATPSTDLKALIDAHWDWAMSESPTYASVLGDRRGDGKLGDISLAAADRSAARADAFAKQLASIPESGLSPDRKSVV